MRENHPAYERFILALIAAIKASDDLIADHGMDCECDPCHLAHGMRFTLGLFQDIATSDAYLSPAICKAEKEIGILDTTEATQAELDALAASAAVPAVAADEPARVRFREFL